MKDHSSKFSAGTSLYFLSKYVSHYAANYLEQNIYQRILWGFRANKKMFFKSKIEKSIKKLDFLI